MTLAAWITAGVVVFVLAMLACTRRGPDVILLAGLAVLLISGVLTPAQAFRGAANPGMITVGLLYVVVAGTQRTGAVDWFAARLLGRPRSLPGALVRLTLPTAALSAFLNNTPVVAMLIPTVREWARRRKLPASKLLLPLSYAAILGGTCTLIGTSTNLVVNGLLISELGDGMRMFDISLLGLPVAAAGLTYLLLAGRVLLPDRTPAVGLADDPRQYTVEMTVATRGPLAGKTIDEAGLRHLPGLYLAEIDRRGEVLAAVGPEQRLYGGDRLVFVGVVSSVLDVQRIRGLEPATDQVFKLGAPRSHRRLIEAVVSDACPVVGRTIREGRFRSRYGAVVIAVARNGERIERKIGDIVLRPGDTLLLEAAPSFAASMRDRRDFYLVSAIPDAAPPQHRKMPVALGILAAMVVAVAAGWLNMLTAALLAGGAMLLTRCLTGTEARRSIDWSVLVVIVAAFGIGEAIRASGLATAVAGQLLRLAGSDPQVALAIVAVLTSLFTELITNNAAAVLMFPIALATARGLDVNFMPFAAAIMISASASFATPLGYQTNLMVYGPGGYRFSDYLRTGVGMNLLVLVIVSLLAPVIWPF